MPITSESEGLVFTENHLDDAAVLLEVANERDRQLDEWGTTTHTIDRWFLILGKTFGKAAQAAFTMRAGIRDVVRRELIQIAAVAVAIVTALDNREDN